ncbi:MAG: aldo/keto reductase [Sphingomonas sp.]|nr:aldo/keto reductase [Sphingomonas sp.]
MRYNNLGKSGLIVSELCLGTMTFGGEDAMWSQIGQLQQSDADTLVKTAIDGGINFFDTANIYAEGRSEQILGQSIRNLGIRREEVVIATKVVGRMQPGPNGVGASRGHILDQVKASLDRLQTDHIDLYQIHGWDPTTPIEETLAALDILVRQGMVRYIGLSNWPAWAIAKASTHNADHGLAPITSLQAYYTIASRDIEREIAPLLHHDGIGMMVWSPLAGGFLSGKYTRQSEGEGRRTTFDFPPIDKERGYDIIEILHELAAAKGRSVAQLALSWLLHRPVVSSVIIGAKRKEQLDDNLGAVDVEFTADELARLDEASKLTPEYPGWMLERQNARRDAPSPRRVAV